MKFTNYLDDYRMIKAYIDKPFNTDDLKQLVVKRNGETINYHLEELKESDHYYKYLIIIFTDYQKGDQYTLEINNQIYPVYLRHIVSKKRFEKENDIDPNKLGSFYRKQYTTFRMFSPGAKALRVVDVLTKKVYPMQELSFGLFELVLKGDHERMAYMYEIEINGKVKRCSDPFAFSSGSNNIFSRVIDLAKLKQHPVKPKSAIGSNCDAVIYEMSVRDFTAMPACGTKTHGKFLSLCESGTSYEGQPTGLDYLIDLGITHIQLMPVFDFGSIDEDSDAYNWGYDPIAYNVLEGSYIVDKCDPYARIKEFQNMINTMHIHDIRINLDLVFNHAYQAENFPLEILYPYHTFRYFNDEELANGSYCGNEIRTDSIFVRKYLLLMCQRYLELFDIDGFRFDLMGLMDIDTVSQITAAMREKKKDFMIYGEGWDMPSPLKSEERSTLNNNYLLPDAAFFNPYFRDSIKGPTMMSNLFDRGYVLDNLSLVKKVEDCLAAYTLNNYFLSPTQSINYVECHDNMTFYDKMRVCLSNETRNDDLARAKLALAFVILSQGIPFIHSGQEFMRTKYGQDNTYNMGDYYNQIDYELRNRNKEVVDFVKDMIKIRKKYPSLRLTTTKAIREEIAFENYYEVLIYRTKEITVFFNPCIYEHIYPIDHECRTIYHHDSFDDVIISKSVIIAPLSISIIDENPYK